MGTGTLEQSIRETGNDSLQYAALLEKMTLMEDGFSSVVVPNGVHEYYINLEQPPEGEEVKCLLRYIRDTNDPQIDVSAFPHLADRVNYLKNEKGGMEDMGEVMDQIWKMGEVAGMEKGIEKGLKKGETLRVIRTVLRMNCDKGMNREEISDLLGEDEVLVDRILLAAARIETDVPEQVYYYMMKN